MKESLISVIMPVYNAEKRLEISIHSILNQTYENFELILVDDGSTDSSPQICEQYAKSDPRVKVLHQENARVSVARNHGIQSANGQFITFIDADDTIDAETFELAIQEFAENSVDMVIFGIKFEYYNKKKVRRSSTRSIGQKVCFDIREIKTYFFHLSENNYFLPVWNKVIKASVIKENDIIFEKEMSILEDFKFVLDVLDKSHRICALSSPYYHYYNDLSSSQLKRRPSINYIRNFQILDRCLRDFSEKYQLNNDIETKKINGMILRYYIIAIEKLFSSSDNLKDKYSEMKRIITLMEFENALRLASVKGKRLTLIYHLLRKKRFRILFLLFFINDYLGKLKK